MDAEKVVDPATAFRACALAESLAVEQPHFGAVSFRVEGKIFAQISADGLTGLVKLPAPLQDWAVLTHPLHCTAEPHWGKYGWTRLTLDGLADELMAELIAASWRAVTPKKLHGQQKKAASD